MNTLHYPSLELCKKLTEIGFPITEKFWQFGKIHDAFRDCMIHSEASVCPSVMELLDIIYPKRSVAEVISRWEKQIGSNRMGNHANVSLPDFLAKEIIWLHENNYISFTK